MVPDTMDALSWLRKQVESADTDLLREMVKVFAERLMGAEIDALCGADYGERSPEPTNRRNGYREAPLGHPRRHDRPRFRSSARARTFPTGCSSPAAGPSAPSSRSWLSATSAAFPPERVEGLVRTLGIERLSKSQKVAVD